MNTDLDPIGKIPLKDLDDTIDFLNAFVTNSPRNTRAVHILKRLREIQGLIPEAPEAEVTRCHQCLIPLTAGTIDGKGARCRPICETWPGMRLDPAGYWRAEEGRLVHVHGDDTPEDEHVAYIANLYFEDDDECPPSVSDARCAHIAGMLNTIEARPLIGGLTKTPASLDNPPHQKIEVGGIEYIECDTGRHGECEGEIADHPRGPCICRCHATPAPVRTPAGDALAEGADYAISRMNQESMWNTARRLKEDVATYRAAPPARFYDADVVALIDAARFRGPCASHEDGHPDNARLDRALSAFKDLVIEDGPGQKKDPLDKPEVRVTGAGFAGGMWRVGPTCDKCKGPTAIHKSLDVPGPDHVPGRYVRIQYCLDCGRRDHAGPVAGHDHLCGSHGCPSRMLCSAGEGCPHPLDIRGVDRCPRHRDPGRPVTHVPKGVQEVKIEPEPKDDDRSACL